MDQVKESLIRRPLYVYGLPQEILTTLQRKADAALEANEAVDSDLNKPIANLSKTEWSPVGSKACSLCEITFHTVEDQRTHTRSDLHRFNLKQKLRGVKTATEDEFERLVGDLDESLSGSDPSETEDEDDSGSRKDTTLDALLEKQAVISADSASYLDKPTSKKKSGSGRPPLIWFSTPALPSNTYLGIYQAIFTNSELENDVGIVDTICSKQLAPKPASKPLRVADNGTPLPQEYNDPHIFCCMIGGGHFAAMVISLVPTQTKSPATGPFSKEATVLAHKTFHRYTTRRKQGGAQSTSDAAKGAAHSAGSSLRRYNEAALTDEVRKLLSDWKGIIESSKLLFIRATGTTNRRTLFGPYDGQVLHSKDPRIRRFPFSTRRATQQELMRCFVEVTRVKVREIDESAVETMITEKAAKQASPAETKQSVPATPMISDEDKTALLHTSQLHALIRRCKLPALLTYLKVNNLSPDFFFYPQDSKQNYHARTSLQLAATLNFPVIVAGLLVKAGASPLPLNGEGKTAFDLAGDRATRDAFRLARSTLGNERWDWSAAHVPSPLTKSEVDDRHAREHGEIVRKEEKRRKAEMERLKYEGPKVDDSSPSRKQASMSASVSGLAQKTAQEKREEETRGLTPEMRARLERELRARAAEERIKKTQSHG